MVATIFDKPPPASAVLEPVYRLLDRDISAVSSPVLVRTIQTLLRLSEAATASGSAWREPFVSANEGGEVVLEWWNGARKLTLYFAPKGSDYLKSWGDDTEAEMQDGAVYGDGTLTELWQWLTA